MDIKKLIAPIVITVLLILVLLGYMVIWAVVPIPFPFKMFLCIVLAALIGVAVYNLITRIREIRSGEEDDLSKY